MITPEQLLAWERAANEATPDMSMATFPSEVPEEQVAYFQELLAYGTGRVWAVVTPYEDKPLNDEALFVAVVGNGPTSEKNARFIATARTAVPALIEEVRRLRGARDRALELIAEMRTYCDGWEWKYGAAWTAETDEIRKETP